MKPAPTSILVLVSLTIISACESDKSIKPFTLNLVLSGPVAQSDKDKLPGFLVALLRPIDSVTCGTVAYLPSLVIRRTDVTPEKVGTLTVPKSSLNELRTKVGTYTYENLLADYDEQLSTMKAGELLYQPTSPPASPADLTGRYPKALRLSTRSIASSEPATTFGSAALLRQYLANQLCQDGDNPTYTVIYLPDKTVSKPITGNPTVIEQINQANDSLANLPNNKQKVVLATQVIDRFDQAAKNQADYRALYALTKTVIYGKQHHEAFEMLREAAQKAIEAGQAAALLNQISTDVNQNSPLARLATPDHRHDYYPIIKALRTNDVSLLRHGHGD